MSGGHWQYRGFQMSDHLEQMGKDADVIIRFPLLAKTFLKLSKCLGDLDHELDWDLSSDEEIENDGRFQTEWLERLRECIK